MGGGADTSAPAPAPAPAPETPVAPWWSGRRIGGVALGGVGLTGLAVGFGMGAVAIAQKGIVSTHCNAATRTCDSTAALNAVSTGRTASTVSTAAFVIGAAALAGGVVLIVLGAPDKGAGTEAQPAVGALKVRGMVAPGGGAIGVSGAF